ncbi:MAG: transposase [Ruminococcaceae bacterium]|nr:transposase [Oscillospiraceae bacterium]
MNKELPNRKVIRLKNFDYSRRGAYFITICTKDRRNILSTVVGEGSPLPRLSCYGKIVDVWIQKISEKYREIFVDSYIIMPNHIHLLLSVSNDGGRGDPSPTVNAAMGWLKYQVTKELNKMRGTAGEKIFQRSFFDHIVRNRDDYNEIYKYISENPIRWKCDKFYSEE